MSAATSAEAGRDRSATAPTGRSATSGLSVVQLTEERLNAKGKSCAAGTVISPNVEGWPDHRVNWHLHHGYAQQVVIEMSAEPPAVAAGASDEEGQLAMGAQDSEDSSDSAPAAADKPAGSDLSHGL